MAESHVNNCWDDLYDLSDALINQYKDKPDRGIPEMYPYSPEGKPYEVDIEGFKWKLRWLESPVVVINGMEVSPLLSRDSLTKEESEVITPLWVFQAHRILTRQIEKAAPELGRALKVIRTAVDGPCPVKDKKGTTLIGFGWTLDDTPYINKSLWLSEANYSPGAKEVTFENMDSFESQVYIMRFDRDVNVPPSLTRLEEYKSSIPLWMKAVVPWMNGLQTMRMDDANKFKEIGCTYFCSDSVK